MARSANQIDSVSDTFEDAYHRVLEEMLVLPARNLLPVNLRISSAVATVLGVLPVLTTFRAQIVQELPRLDIARLDKLEDYTLALSHASTLHLTATRPPGALKAAYDEGFRLRRVLHSDTRTLVRRGLIQATALERYSGRVGYATVAADLQLVGQLLKTHWDTIEGRCATTHNELARAFALAARLLRLAGQRDQTPEAAAHAAEMRSRAFTLLITAYDEARRALRYLRWRERDEESIAPNLYDGYAGRRIRRSLAARRGRPSASHSSFSDRLPRSP